MNSCNVGLQTTSECSVEEQFQNLQDLKDDEYNLLKHRIDKFYKILNGTICAKHIRRYLEDYSLYQKICCNPFEKHAKASTSKLSIVHMKLCEDAIHYLVMHLKPGSKLCVNCKKELTSAIQREKEKSERNKEVQTELQVDIYPEITAEVKIFPCLTIF